MQFRRRSVLAALGAAAAGVAGRPAFAQTADPPRPRVLATGEDFDRVARLLDESDTHAVSWYSGVKERAREILAETAVEYELPDGVRLLPISREVLSRVRALGLVYRLSGDAIYADRAWRELEAATAFDTWHPEHFLDVAEMTNAVATGYDWMYDHWDEAQRERLREALLEKGLSLGLDAHEGHTDFGWWADDEYNWNSVCNGGLSVGACALVGEDDVDHAVLEELLSYTSEGILEAFETFGVDGGWPEGYSYWSYNTRYQVYYLSTMLNTLDDAGMDVPAGVPDVDGFPSSGEFPMGMVGPRGAFNFADSGSGTRPMPELFWLARQFDEPAWAAFQRQAAGTSRGSVTDLLWYDPDAVGSVDDKPRDMLFRGLDVATMRTQWGGKGGLFNGYVGFKGGWNGHNHGDLDLGSFVYDAEGVRWATDLGADDYNLPGYFGARRWDYYRKRAEGHNTLVVDPGRGPDQPPDAEAPITAFETGPGGGYGTVDLTEASRTTYVGEVEESVRRGFAFDRATRALLIQDELALAEPVPVWWFMHTGAEAVARGDRTTATLNGKTPLEARILEPEGAEFQVMAAAPLESSPDPAQNRNHGIRKLAIRLEDVTDARLAVQLAPLTDDPPERPDVRPLDEWTVDYAGSPEAIQDRETKTASTAETVQETEPGGGDDQGTTATTTDDPTTTSTGGPGFGPAGAVGGAGIAAGAGLAARRLLREDGDGDDDADRDPADDTGE